MKLEARREIEPSRIGAGDLQCFMGDVGSVDLGRWQLFGERERNRARTRAGVDDAEPWWRRNSCPRLLILFLTLL